MSESIDDFIETHDDEKLVSYSTRKYVRVHDAILDTGIRHVIGLQTYEVFYALHRFIWRSERTGHPVLRKMRDEGHVVANVKQAKLAEQSGISRQRLIVHIARLRALGWIKSEPIDGGSLVYVLGFLATPHGERVDPRDEEILFQERWERRFYTTISKWAVDEKHMPLHDVPFNERLDFGARYINLKHALAKIA